MTENKKPSDKRSLFQKVLGRSFFSMLFGGYFQNKNNAAGLVAFTLVSTFCFIAIYTLITGKELSTDLTNGILNVIFVVIGYYFGAKMGRETKEGDENDTQSGL